MNAPPEQLCNFDGNLHGILGTGVGPYEVTNRNCRSQDGNFPVGGRVSITAEGSDILLDTDIDDVSGRADGGGSLRIVDYKLFTMPSVFLYMTIEIMLTFFALAYSFLRKHSAQ